MKTRVTSSFALVIISTLAGGALAQEAPKAPAGEAPAMEPKKMPGAQPGAAHPAPAAATQPNAAAEPMKPVKPEAQKPAAPGGAEKPVAGQKPGQAAPAQNANKPAAAEPKNGKPAAAQHAGQAKPAPKISGEQRTQAVRSFRGVNVSPVRVDFHVNLGVAVPRTVVLAPVPREVITIVPEYEGYEFFETPGEIVIVDPATLEIVAVLPL